MSWKEFGSESRPSPDESFRIGTTAHALPTGSLVLRRLSLDLFRSILRSLNFSSTASTRHMCTAAFCSDCRNRDSEAVPLRGSAEAPYAEVNCVGFTSAEASASVLSALGPTGHSFTLDNPRERYPRPGGPSCPSSWRISPRVGQAVAPADAGGVIVCCVSPGLALLGRDDSDRGGRRRTTSSLHIATPIPGSIMRGSPFLNDGLAS